MIGIKNLYIIRVSFIVGLLMLSSRGFGSNNNSGDITFHPLYTKCLKIKKELTHPNLSITYSARPRKPTLPKVWLLRWQKVYIPIPQKQYVTLIIFRYHKSVRKYAISPGFILLAKDGTAIIAMHYFKTLKYVYTNGIAFADNFPENLRSHVIVKDLKQPEISTTSQTQMFNYAPSSLICARLKKYKRTVMTALLMVKLDYSLGELLSVYKSMGGYSGWVSKEKISLKDHSGSTNYLLWKGFYSRLFSKSVMNHVRIYSPHNIDIKNLEFIMGYYSKAGYQNRPEWLYQLEKILYKNSVTNRTRFLKAIRHANFDSVSQKSAATSRP